MGNNSYICIEEDSKDAKGARKRTMRGTNITGYFAIEAISVEFVFRMSRLRW